MLSQASSVQVEGFAVQFENPKVTDFGSIAGHTFTRCDDAGGGSDAPPKDPDDFKHDKFGECSDPGANGVS